MLSPSSYDPDPDLALLRPPTTVRVGVGCLLAALVCELGSFLQLVTADGVPWVLAWIWAKLGLVLIALHCAVRTSGVKPGAAAYFGAVTLGLLLESAGWIAFSTSAGYFSCFAFFVPVAALFASLAIPAVAAATKTAEAARDRLAQNGIDAPF